MGILDIFKKKGASVRVVDEDAEIGYRERAAKAQSTRLRNNRVREIYDRIDEINAEIELKKAEDVLNSYQDDDEDEMGPEDFMQGPDGMLMMLLSKIINHQQGGISSPPSPQAPPPPQPSISIEQFRQMKESYPKNVVQKLKKQTDEQIRIAILERYPNLSEENIVSAIQVIRE